MLLACGLNIERAFPCSTTSITRILLYLLFFFCKKVHTSDQTDKEIKVLQALAYEATGCRPKILKAFYHTLEADVKKKLNIDIEQELIFINCNKIYNCLHRKDRLLKMVSLDLSNLDIEDITTSLFSKTKNLKQLRLSGNPRINLKSKVFEMLCSQLVDLCICDCNIDKEVFSIICSCPKLQKLCLSNSPDIKFSEHNLENLRENLRELYIDNCNLSTEDMIEIAKFEKLENLDISGNVLKEFFETFDLGNLRGTLIKLRASKICISLNDLYRIQECLKISELEISQNDLRKKGDICSTSNIKYSRFQLLCTKPKNAKDPEEPFLGNLENQLKSLKVSKANLGLKQIKRILNFPNVETLDCSFNDLFCLNDTFEIGEAKKSLKNVNFSHCYLTNQGFLEEVLNFQNLSIADFSENRFDLKYSTFKFGASMYSLKRLNISGSRIKLRPFFKILRKSQVLEYLDVSNNHFSSKSKYFKSCNHGQNIFELGSIKMSLKTLKISNCNIHNDYDFFYSLTDCEILEDLDICFNCFCHFPKSFHFGSSRKTLKYLKMNNCSMCEVNALEAVTNLEVIENLIISYNTFTRIPNGFKFGISRNSIKTILMANCKIRNAQVLHAISECKVLEVLNLSNNNFSKGFGKFDLGSAKFSLRSIYMSNCRIRSPVLLKAITDCIKLLKLDLSHNNFSGLPHNFTFGQSRFTLEELNMFDCYLGGPKILYAITNCDRLVKLCLSKNDFSQLSENLEVGFSFGASKNSLKILEMDFCKMKDPKLLNAITSCEVLKTLSIGNNLFSFHNYNYSLGKSKRTLKYLKIRSMIFSKAEDLCLFLDLPNLEMLDMSYSLLNLYEQDLNIDHIGCSRSTLKKLNIDGCKLLNPSSLLIFTSFPKLREISISCNCFKAFPENFELGESRNTLNKIIAISCNLQDKNIVKALTDCINLKSLILDENSNLEMAGKVTFGISKDSLKELKLNKCNISLSSWMDEIRRCSKLAKINLAYNSLSLIRDEFDFEGLRNSVISLNLYGCGINHLKILSSLANYHCLEYLVLDSNDLSSLNHKFDFGKLQHKLIFLSLVECKLKNSCKRKIDKSFIFINHLNL